MQQKSGGLIQLSVRYSPFIATMVAAVVFYAALVFLAPRVGGLLLSSAGVVIPSAALALLIGTPMGLVLARQSSANGRVAITLLVALLLLPLHVTTTAWMAALGDLGGLPTLLAGEGSVGGVLAGYRGAILLHAIIGVPWAALLSLGAWRLVDQRLVDQALLEAGSLAVLLRVTLVQAAPALMAAGVILAVLAASEIAVTDLLRLRTFAEEIYTQAAAGQLNELASLWRIGLGVGVLGCCGAAAMLLLMARPPIDADTQPGWHSKPSGIVAWGLWLTLLPLVAIPFSSLAYRAGTKIESTATGPVATWEAGKLLSSVALAPWQHRRELGVSVLLAGAVASAALPLGALCAWSLRGSLRRGAIGGALLVTLMAVPGPVIGVLVIRVLNQPLDAPLAWLGSLYGTWFAPWIAQLLRVVPPVGLLLWPVFQRVPTEVLEAARVDAAGWSARWSWVVLPMVAPSLIAVWLVAFSLSLGELSATVLVVPPGTPPLSVRLLSLLHYGVEDRVAAISLVLLLVYVAIAAVVIRLLPLLKRLG